MIQLNATIAVNLRKREDEKGLSSRMTPVVIPARGSTEVTCDCVHINTQPAQAPDGYSVLNTAFVRKDEIEPVVPNLAICALLKQSQDNSEASQN